MIKDKIVTLSVYYDQGATQIGRFWALAGFVTLAGVYRATLDYYHVPLVGFIMVLIISVIIANVIIGYAYVKTDMLKKTSAKYSEENVEWNRLRKDLDGLIESIKKIEERLGDGDQNGKR